MNKMNQWICGMAMGLAGITGFSHTPAAHAQATDSAQEAQEQTQPVNESMGVLTDILTFGQDGPWMCGYDGEGRGYLMMNESDPYAIKFFYVQPAEGDAGRRRFGVDVTVMPGNEQTMAGLIYAHTSEPLHYFLVTIDGQGTVRLLERTDEGIAERMSVAGPEQFDWPVRLEAAEVDGVLEISVNGQNLGGMGSDGMMTGACGVAAVGGGVLIFNDFAYEVVE